MITEMAKQPDTVRDNPMGELANRLNERFKPLEVSYDQYFVYLKVEPQALVSVMQSLYEDWGMNYLGNLDAVDYGEEFEVVYHLYGIPAHNKKIAVKVRVPRHTPSVPSLTSIYPTADWQEREAYDLMGIQFAGHPNLVRVLLPDGFTGHPLRKDFGKGA